jgi:hypothetical protein
VAASLLTSLKREPHPRLIHAAAPLRFWHLLSLDAPTVAVVWALAFAWATRVVLEPWVPILLALITWAVYLADRIFDAYFALRAGRLSCLRERHIFHWRHWQALATIAVVASVAALSIIVKLMPIPAREHNSVLAGAALVYFSGVYSGRNLPNVFPFSLMRRRPLAKLHINEFLVGLIFTAAATLPTWSRLIQREEVRRGGSGLWPLALVSAFFVLLAWLNYRAIGRWEAAAAQTRIRAAATGLGLFGLCLTCLIALINARLALLIGCGATSALMLAMLDRYRNRLAPTTLRAAADFVLLVPAVLLIAPIHP